MKHFRLFCVAFVAVSAAGCVSSVSMRYEPTTPARPLSLARKPRIHLSKVDDKTLGIQTQGALPVGLSRPADMSVAEALTKEFERIGLPLAASEKEADASLIATIENIGVSWGGGLVVPYRGLIRLGLSFREKTSRRVIWEGELNGTGELHGAGGGYAGSKPARAISMALNNAMAKLGPLFEAEQLADLLFAPPREGAEQARAQAAPVSPAAPSSDLDDLPRAVVPRRAHAVVIGIENYREGLPRADFAASDAKLAAEYFKRVLGVPAENLALLVDDRATNVDFQKYIERWLPNRVKEGDEVFIYFSGHGSPNPAKGDAYLVPYDGDPTYIEQTGYSVKRMYDHLAQLPAKRVIVAMDSCFSGAGGRSVLAKGARPLVSLQTSEVPTKITVLSASAGDQISNSYQEKGHGLFTYYFLKGLKEKGADLRAVYGYLKPEVARVAREQYNADQDPQWRGGK